MTTRVSAERIRHLWSKDIAEIWSGLNKDLIFGSGENNHIAVTANYWALNARCFTEQNRRPLWKAHQVLAKWCATHRIEAEKFVKPLLPDLIAIGEEALAATAFNGRILVLEQALARTRDLLVPRPAKQSEWAVVAPMVWQEAARSLKSKGRRAGTSASSYAIRFTSEVLGRLGYPRTTLGATPDGVRKEVKKFLSLPRGQGVQSDTPTDTLME